MAGHTITLGFTKETKGAVQYKEADLKDPHYLVGTIYLRKAGMGHHLGVGTREFPARIRVTVEVLT